MTFHMTLSRLWQPFFPKNWEANIDFFQNSCPEAKTERDEGFAQLLQVLGSAGEQRYPHDNIRGDNKGGLQAVNKIGGVCPNSGRCFTTRRTVHSKVKSRIKCITTGLDSPFAACAVCHISFGYSRTAQVTSMLRKEQEEEARLAEKLQEQKYQSEAQGGQLGRMI